LSRHIVKIDYLKDQVSDSRKIFEQYKAKEKVHYKYISLIKKKKLKLKALCKLKDALELDTAFITYGLQVFSKDGLPAYLIQTLCPQLNIAAAKYARLISEDEIRVKFKIDDDGAIIPKIKNAHGGEFIDDQSQGETRLASSITSFAVRDVINPANILILDEPGEGLDATNAAKFADVLKEVSKRFGLILVTSHNPIILSALENERHIYIEKKNKIARVIKGI
jgi:DNA repair exonuclease SbcCD ATPase subunit